MDPLFFDTNPYPTLHIWGGEGERDSGDQGQSDPNADADKDDDDVDVDDNNDDDDDDDSNSDDGDKAKDGEKSLQDQLDEEKRLRLKAERKLANAQKAKDDAEADKDAVKDRDKYKAKLEARDKWLTENLLEIEISKQKKYDFVDVDDVITLIQTKYSDEVNIDLDADIPSVEGLELALKRIAKDKPHFLKPAKKDDDDDDSSPPPSGDKAGGGKLGSQAEEDKLLGQKYKIPGYGTESLRLM